MRPKILAAFSVELSLKQARKIGKQFQAALAEHQVDRAALLAQPVTTFGGMSHVRLKPPRLEVAVISAEVFEKLQAVLKEETT